MPLLPARVSMTVLSAEAGGNPQWNRTWKQSTNQLQWSSSNLIPLGRTLQTCIAMSISCSDCWGGQVVMRRWRCIFARTSWTLSRNASSVGGLPHCQGQNWCLGGQLMPLDLTPKPSSIPRTIPIMNSSWALSGIPARKPWPWPGMPTDGHWWLQHCGKKRLRG